MCFEYRTPLSAPNAFRAIDPRNVGLSKHRDEELASVVLDVAEALCGHGGEREQVGIEAHTAPRLNERDAVACCPALSVEFAVSPIVLA
jgi:hypothetical protein